MSEIDQALSNLFGNPPCLSVGDAWSLGRAGADEVSCVSGVDLARVQRHPDAHCLPPLMSSDRLFEDLSSLTFDDDEQTAMVMGAATEGIGGALALVLYARPQRTTGLTYCGLALFPCENGGLASVEIRCPEAGTTGLREALVGARSLSDSSLPPAHHVAWDEHFPGHPLTRLHGYMHSLMRSGEEVACERPSPSAAWRETLLARLTAGSALETLPVSEDWCPEYLRSFDQHLHDQQLHGGMQAPLRTGKLRWMALFCGVVFLTVALLLMIRPTLFPLADSSQAPLMSLGLFIAGMALSAGWFSEDLSW